MRTWPSQITIESYRSFGMVMKERSWEATSTDKYRFGYNGKEDDNESGTQDYGFRIYNPALCKFLSVDPLTKDYPWYTPYQFAGNTPIQAIDLDGLEPKFVNCTEENGVKADNYEDKESRQKFKVGKGAIIGQLNEGRLVAYSNAGSYYTWDANISDFAKTSITFGESGQIGLGYEEIELTGQRQESFSDKHPWMKADYYNGHDNITGESTPEGVVVQPNATAFGRHFGLTFGFLKHDGFNLNGYSGGQFSLYNFQAGVIVGSVSTNGYGQVKWSDFRGDGSSYSLAIEGVGYSEAWSGKGFSAKAKSKYEINAISIGVSSAIMKKLDFKVNGTYEKTKTTKPLF